MKKILLLCLLHTLFFVPTVNSQAVPPRVQIIAATDTIAFNYSGGVRTHTIKITLQLSGAFNAIVPANNSVPFAIAPGTIPAAAAPVFLNGTPFTAIMLPASDWPGVGAYSQVSVTLSLQFPSIAGIVLSGDVMGQIQLTGIASNFHNILLSENKTSSAAYKPNKPFWIEVGSNFDLIDGLEPNNLFAGVFFHKRDIRKFHLFKKRPATPEQRNLGIFAGVFESKTISTLSKGEIGIHSYYDENSFTARIPNQPDSFWLFRSSGPIARKQMVRNVGLFFSPQFRLSHGSANEDGLHFFVSLWIELQWQKITNQEDYSGVRKLDSIKLDVSNDLEANKAKTLKSEADIKSHYMGIGFPIFFRQEVAGSEHIHLFINPIVGISNQPDNNYLEALLNPKSSNPGRKWGAFFATQFRLNEERFGIAFTGEVRGLIKKNSQPFVSLALSKKFDLAKFLEFTK